MSDELRDYVKRILEKFDRASLDSEKAKFAGELSGAFFGYCYQTGADTVQAARDFIDCAPNTKSVPALLAPFRPLAIVDRRF